MIELVLASTIREHVSHSILLDPICRLTGQRDRRRILSSVPRWIDLCFEHIEPTIDSRCWLSGIPFEDATITVLTS
jgi:hypothetical protein